MATTPDRERLEAELIRITRAATDIATKIRCAFAEKHGLHITDSRALSLVFAAELAGQYLTARELADALNLTAGAITHSVDRLAAAGFVWRDYDSNDRRRVLLRTTPAGEELAKEFHDPVQAAYRRAFESFSDAQLQVYLRVHDSVRESFTRLYREQSADPDAPAD